MNDQPPSPTPPAPAPEPVPAAPAPSRKSAVLKWVKFSLRWGIAVVGIWIVISQISCKDQVWTIGANNQLVRRSLQQAIPANPNEPQSFRVENGTAEGELISWDQTANKAELKTIRINAAAGGGTVDVPLVGLDLRGELDRARRPERLFVIEPVVGPDGKQVVGRDGPETVGHWIDRSRVDGDFLVRLPYPRVEPGIVSMIHQAKGWLLVLSVVIFPVTFIVTSVRWDMLLRALGIYLSLGRAFTLNMVGAFYNSFLIGSTGGDFLKAYYASKHTPHRTRAVLSVIVDRVIGLLALVLMGGVMAAYQYGVAGPQDPAGHACGKIALVSAAILLASAAGYFVLGHAAIRRMTGVEWVLGKLPKQKQVRAAVQTMEIYGRRPLLVVSTLLMTLPVHITVVLSAMFAGKAFGLTISPLYYFVAVPVIVLVGAIPISPQGAGVMEYFAILLLQRQGATVSQAFALTMSIRMVQILWNLTGGLFVFRGGYHAPSEREKADLETDLPPDAASGAAAPAV